MERRLIAVKRQRSLEPSLDLFSYPNPDSRSYLMFHKLDCVCVGAGGGILKLLATQYWLK